MESRVGIVVLKLIYTLESTYICLSRGFAKCTLRSKDTARATGSNACGKALFI